MPRWRLRPEAAITALPRLVYVRWFVVFLFPSFRILCCWLLIHPNLCFKFVIFLDHGSYHHSLALVSRVMLQRCGDARAMKMSAVRLLLRRLVLMGVLAATIASASSDHEATEPVFVGATDGRVQLNATAGVRAAGRVWTPRYDKYAPSAQSLVDTLQTCVQAVLQTATAPITTPNPSETFVHSEPASDGPWVGYASDGTLEFAAGRAGWCNSKAACCGQSA